MGGPGGFRDDRALFGLDADQRGAADVHPDPARVARWECQRQVDDAGRRADHRGGSGLVQLAEVLHEDLAVVGGAADHHHVEVPAGMQKLERDDVIDRRTTRNAGRRNVLAPVTRCAIDRLPVLALGAEQSRVPQDRRQVRVGLGRRGERADRDHSGGGDQAAYRVVSVTGAGALP